MGGVVDFLTFFLGGHKVLSLGWNLNGHIHVWLRNFFVARPSSLLWCCGLEVKKMDDHRVKLLIFGSASAT